MDWLLSEDALLELQAIKGAVPTAEQREAFAVALKAHEAALAAGEPRILKIDGSEAQITIDGVLTERPSFMSMFMRGGTAFYSEIRAAFEAAETDPRVKSIALSINSPGGSVDGMFETLDAIAQVTKKIKVKATMATSAAYAIAAMAGPIEAATRSSQFGSVGVVARFMVWPEDVTLTSSDAPEKAPDPRTPDGKALIVKRLDAINEMFVGAIAKGRTAFSGSKVSADAVKQNFGRGSTMFAEAAKAAGLIDKAPKEPKLARGGVRAEDEPEADASAIAADGGESESESMTLQELKAKHPDLFEQIRAEAHAAGVETERKRVKAHLLFGEKSGDGKTAAEAIRNGVAHDDPETQAAYMMAATNRADRTARSEDSAVTAAAVSGATPPATPAAPAAATAAPGTATPAAAQPDLGDAIIAAIEADRAANA